MKVGKQGVKGRRVAGERGEGGVEWGSGGGAGSWGVLAGEEGAASSCFHEGKC